MEPTITVTIYIKITDLDTLDQLLQKVTEIKKKNPYAKIHIEAQV